MIPAGTETGIFDSQVIGCLRKLVRARFGVEVTDLIPLADDASDRRYARLHHPDAAPPTSVGMILAAPFADGELPFLNVRNHFEIIGAPVPHLYEADPACGVLLLEDAGEVSLEALWEREGREGARPYYLEAVDLLASIQAGAESPDPASPHLALRYAFDEAVFVRELHHTQKYAFGELLEMAAGKSDFDESFGALARAVCSQPFRLTHRDYHSRNLMVRGGGNLTVLDFQDARLGPAAYDLASLVFDSYVSLPDSLREELITRFIDRTGIAAVADAETFRTRLSWTALQRNLKAIGTFAHQKTAHGTSRYLRHIPPALAHIQCHLAALPGTEDLADRLAPYLDALETALGEITD
jgi:hypothetical protein